MTAIEFENMEFEESGDFVRVTLLRLFETNIPKKELEQIGEFVVFKNKIEFPNTPEKKANNKMTFLMQTAFSNNNLKNKLTGRRAVYVHRNSGIPLFGTLYFGIVDRGTNIIEVKPITGCNLDCVFCSVNEGGKCKKFVDFVVEPGYLIAEVEKVINFKKEDSFNDKKFDIFINTHGEPLLYAGLLELISDLREIKDIGTISIITNATLLTKKFADELVAAGLNQINISLNAAETEKAKELAGTTAYNLTQIMDVAEHLAKKIRVVIAPVWIKGLNDEEIPKIIKFAKKIGAETGIQNYIIHKKGKKPLKKTKQVEWKEFYKQLEEWEKETGTVLRLTEHSMFKTKLLEKPFKKGDVVKARLVCPGRMKNEMLAVSCDRVISVLGCEKESGEVRMKLIKDKDGVFVGVRKN
jgi:uncharacterized Fe-S cluster-containing radical SAM superfamily enzyme